ncbi:unnamed protein product [Pleuronectes platessa]|uniref:Uncharacterized protein n=1 Tax=Pleuronectes platessa TaxID=8262 RepID=A0A9N7U3C2_PLEPL|nr:unnamed protein product [Pleuronectes platessa]
MTETTLRRGGASGESRSEHITSPDLTVLVLHVLLGGSTDTSPSEYRWRIDLSKSEKYWDGWFRGTSNLFLTCNLPKLLLLAGRTFRPLFFSFYNKDSWVKVSNCFSHQESTDWTET